MAEGKIRSNKNLLWTGTLSGNVSITVPNASKYTLFALQISDGSLLLGGMNHNQNKIDFSRASMLSGSNTIYTDCVQFTVSGDTWTRIGAVEIAHNPSGNHGSASGLTAKAIYGLI